MFLVSDLFCADKDTNVAVNSFLLHLAKLEISHSTSQAITDCGLLVEPKLLLEVAGLGCESGPNMNNTPITNNIKTTDR